MIDAPQQATAYPDGQPDPKAAPRPSARLARLRSSLEARRQTVLTLQEERRERLAQRQQWEAARQDLDRARLAPPARHREAARIDAEIAAVVAELDRITADLARAEPAYRDLGQLVARCNEHEGLNRPGESWGVR